MTASAHRLLRRLSISATGITRPAAAEEAQAKSITPMKSHSASVSGSYPDRFTDPRAKTTTITGAAAAIDQIHHLNAIRACTSVLATRILR
jgi:hypothetical protein